MDHVVWLMLALVNVAFFLSGLALGIAIESWRRSESRR